MGKRNIRNRMRLISDHGQKCPVCGRPFSPKINAGNSPSRDHIVPKVMGGQTSTKNLQVICRDCNHLKGSAAIQLTDLEIDQSTLALLYSKIKK